MSDDLGPPGELDPAAVARLESIGGSALVAQIFGLVLEQGPSRVANAWDGMRRGDLASVRLAAHSLRSSAGNIGATRLFAVARQVEELALAGMAETSAGDAAQHPAAEATAAALSELESEWGRICAVLETRRAELL